MKLLHLNKILFTREIYLILITYQRIQNVSSKIHYLIQKCIVQYLLFIYKYGVMRDSDC